MRRSVMELLRCPCCEATDLRLEAEPGDEVETGTLKCTGCGEGFPITEGIARMLPSRLRGASESPEVVKKQSEMAARDAQTEDYDRMRGLRLFGKIEVPATLAMLRPGAGDTLLEAGCGTGRMTRVFAARCACQVSIDFSFESLRTCRRKLRAEGVTNVDLVQADVCALPLRSEVFDRVVSCQVLEHIPTPESRARMVSELARVAAPNSCVVISAYQHSLFTRLFGAKEGEHAGGIYYYRFGRRELRDLLSRSFDVRNLTGALVYHYMARCRKTAG